ncbi:hypothetical protein DL240_01690 [Lujinxingia litoralis]|uniref:Haem-binding uptake Tiki superfamily ChaN domain-containing protein n=1 Tax=Lujinxingia litoralis TaxID=2211119 RepID=A0A328CAG6_9DELT|nr:ChaN family lipoprotein [Lujinxingia litoralis]RAL24948.1 hypothetical protein DL240_01690 [Lujinxingia litoralis]
MLKRLGWEGVVVLMMVLLVQGACASPSGATRAPTPGTEAPGELLGPGIWEVATGRQLSEAELVAELSGARFVVAGESHDDDWHHEVQRRLYAGLSAQRPGQVALGVEMVEARFQSALDAYLEGSQDEAAMLEGVGWEERWGMDWEMYAPMWRTAREYAQPVVGLNAPRELVRRVGRGGLEALSEEERRGLPELDLSDAEYRAWLQAIFAAHGMGDDTQALDRFFAAQVLWDETMAARAVEVMLASPELAQMVLLVGRGHAERGFGIPPRIERRMTAAGEPAAVPVVIPVSAVGEEDAGQDEYRRLRYLQEKNIADFVWIEAGDA